MRRAIVRFAAVVLMILLGSSVLPAQAAGGAA
jgi:hypothetical protein